jgi:PPK2 family polyphosphate:nucleotide phosphotransferase
MVCLRYIPPAHGTLGCHNSQPYIIIFGAAAAIRPPAALERHRFRSARLIEHEQRIDRFGEGATHNLDRSLGMIIDTEDFRVPHDRKIKLRHFATVTRPFYQSEKHYKKLLAADVEVLSGLQRLLYASDSYSILLIFQAMDTAGKDGAISHVLTGVNPQGCEVYSFKPPSAEEAAHDFLWRTTCRLPARGRIGVFNRSYYEEVLVTRVHPAILRNEGIPNQLVSNKAVWEGRYRSIVDLESHLHRNGTRVIKFFLHLSKDEQRRRLVERIDEPDKNWKFSRADITERRFWSQYMSAYEECLSATSTKATPWHVVPADDKYNARLIVSRVVIEALQRLDMSYPKVTRARQKELLEMRKQLQR